MAHQTGGDAPQQDAMQHMPKLPACLATCPAEATSVAAVPQAGSMSVKEQLTGFHNT